MTNLEKAFQNMTPAQRKKAAADISSMMGVMGTPKKRQTKAKTTTKKRGK